MMGFLKCQFINSAFGEMENFCVVGKTFLFPEQVLYSMSYCPFIARNVDHHFPDFIHRAASREKDERMREEDGKGIAILGSI